MVRKPEVSSGGNETRVTLSTKPIHRGGDRKPIVKGKQSKLQTLA